MSNTMIINRTTLNGAQWQIVEDGFGVALMVKPAGSTKDFYFSGYCFKDIEGANDFLNKIDARFLAPKPEVSYEVPSDYYGVRNRYYGD